MGKNGTNGATPPKIEAGVPLPRRSRESFYPWEQMKVGDSFLFSKDLESGTPYQLAKQASQRLGRKFKAHRTPDGARCWRTE